MKRMTMIALVSLLPTLLAAAEHSGVTMPNTVEVDGEELVLNGMGLRKKAIFKIYVAGLYLTEKTSDPSTVFARDSTRRTEMQFQYNVKADQLCDAWNECLAGNNPDASEALEAQFDTLCSYMDATGKGETMVYTYVPGRGTAVEVKGEVKGSLPGKEFADALWACWIGPKPATQALKEGLLGQ